MLKYLSRSSQIDTNKCVDLAGGNRFALVIMASARSREIKRQNILSQKFEHLHSNITALLEFQDGKLDQSYMKKIKFSEPNDRNRDHRAKYIGR
jgi:DNA-directed RNA polymerase subunit K/omega